MSMSTDGSVHGSKSPTNSGSDVKDNNPNSIASVSWGTGGPRMRAEVAAKLDEAQKQKKLEGKAAE